MGKEIWKDVKGYEGLYWVSNFGRVKSNGTIRKPWVNWNGYYRLDFHKKNIRKNDFVHRVVAKAFIKKKNGCDCINHLDGNRLNNRVNNLEWVTKYENSYHGHKKTKKYVGVYDRKKYGNYKTEIFHNSQTVYLGVYTTPEEAHLAYLMGFIMFKKKNKYVEI